MSKETDIVQAVRTACAGVSGWRATTIPPEGFDKLQDRTVYVLADRVDRSDINAAKSRWTMQLVLLICSKLGSETPTVPAIQRRNDDARAILAAVIADAGVAAYRPVRGSTQYLTWPAGDAGRISGAAVDLAVTWDE